MWPSLLLAALNTHPVPVEPVPAPEEVLVYGDRFARWDGTRWYAETQIGFAAPWILYAEADHEVRFSAMQLRADIGCDKTWRHGAKGFEVRCPIEQISVRGVTSFPNEPWADLVLQELDDLLTGAVIKLVVTEDGRLTDLGLDGPPADNRRATIIHENARQLLLQLMSNFNLRLPPATALSHNSWVEYGSTLFLPPTLSVWTNFPYICPKVGRIFGSLPRPTSAFGGTTLVHQLTPYRGKIVLQSSGQGTLSDGYEQANRENFYALHFDGVSIFDPATGIMTERVYALRGETTASSAIAMSGSSNLYFHTGRIQLLGDTASIATGFTGRVVHAEDAAEHPGVPLWTPMD
jgi:hypothetical protein